MQIKKKNLISQIFFQKKKFSTISDETLKCVIDSVNYKSLQFNDIGQQLK